MSAGFTKQSTQSWTAAATAIVAVVVASISLCGCHGRAIVQRNASRGKSGGVWQPPVSVTMAGGSTGWALTATSVLRTTDGGVSWANVTPAGATASQYAHGLGQLCATGPDSAWLACVPGADPQRVTLLHTCDGGKTWTESQVGYTGFHAAWPLGISFIDKNHGALLVNYEGVAMGSEMVAVFTTADEGATWVQAAITNSTGRAPNALPLGGIKSGATFTDENRGWVTGYWHGDGVWLYFTRDGGQNWQSSDLPVPTGYSTLGGNVQTLPPLFFGRDGVLPVVFHTERSVIFFTTSDGGDTWKATTPVSSSADSYSFSWSFIDGTHGWVSDTARVFTTSDGAASWTELEPDEVLRHFIQTNQRIEQIGFSDSRNGWAVLCSGHPDSATCRLLKSTDGGRSWTDGGEVSSTPK